MSAEYCTICGRWHDLTTAGCPKPEITVAPARDQTNYDPEAERAAWAASDERKDAEIRRLKKLAITMIEVWYRTNHIPDRETYEAKRMEIEGAGK